jgi:hypothetical protein
MTEDDTRIMTKGFKDSNAGRSRHALSPRGVAATVL